MLNFYDLMGSSILIAFRTLFCHLRLFATLLLIPTGWLVELATCLVKLVSWFNLLVGWFNWMVYSWYSSHRGRNPTSPGFNFQIVKSEPQAKFHPSAVHILEGKSSPSTSSSTQSSASSPSTSSLLSSSSRS